MRNEPLPHPLDYAPYGSKVPAPGYEPPIDPCWLSILRDKIKEAGGHKKASAAWGIDQQAILDATSGRELTPAIRLAITMIVRDS